MNFSISLSIIRSFPLMICVIPSRWSSTAHEKSRRGQTRYLFLTRGCSLSEILNKTLSRNAGFGCCMLVFNLNVHSPSLALNIVFHLSSCLAIEYCLQAHSIPFALLYLSVSELQEQAYAFPFLISSSAYL